MNDASSIHTDGRLARRFAGREFAITAEIVPPVAGSSEALLAKAEPLKGIVDAVNVTDGASARVHMSSLASAGILAANDIEPIAQFTCRDRNRIALMSDLLGAAALGVKAILVLNGDDPTAGDQPDAKPVFDLTSADLISVAHRMGAEASVPTVSGPPGRAITDPPRFLIGAADMPNADGDERWAAGLEKKIEAGATFIQTQLCYDLELLQRYAERLAERGWADRLNVLVGNGPLLSVKSALWMRDNLFGVKIPDAVIARLEGASDPKVEGVRICAEQLQAIAEMPEFAGAHLMSPLNAGSIPDAVQLADIPSRPS
ncbi:MAG: 5,10-methylenetetrahydrofolate reductase [Rhodospirillaceae bacterium]|nr:5,10-methylenetetrahydrofolate reductase [Rhodospirillaceae bacterium]